MVSGNLALSTLILNIWSLPSPKLTIIPQAELPSLAALIVICTVSPAFAVFGRSMLPICGRSKAGSVMACAGAEAVAQAAINRNARTQLSIRIFPPRLENRSAHDVQAGVHVDYIARH